ncbi:MAG: hypothetical protein ACRDM1_11240 [Gaiellaceae bacterium]
MHTRHLRSVPLALCAAAVLLLSCAGTVSAESSTHSNLAGTWSGRYGGAFSGTFTLRWTQTRSRLHGTITLSKPRGTYNVSGALHGKKISFGAVGVGATYTGSVAGRSMSGHYKTPGGGGTWSAHKRS